MSNADRTYALAYGGLLRRYSNGEIDRRTMEAEREELRNDRAAQLADEDRADAMIGEPIDLADWAS